MVIIPHSFAKINRFIFKYLSPFASREKLRAIFFAKGRSENYVRKIFNTDSHLEKF